MPDVYKLRKALRSAWGDEELKRGTLVEVEPFNHDYLIRHLDKTFTTLSSVGLKEYAERIDNAIANDRPKVKEQVRRFPAATAQRGKTDVRQSFDPDEL